MRILHWLQDKELIIIGLAVSWISFAAGSLTACSATAAGPSGDSGTSVTVVRLDDGTRCAVMDKRGDGGVAIDCDWP